MAQQRHESEGFIRVEKKDSKPNVEICFPDGYPVVVVFPGQGSQFPGMGKDLIQDKETSKAYKEADRITTLPIGDVSYDEGVYLEDPLFSRLSVFVRNNAILEEFKKDPLFNPKILGGRDVGFFNALVAAGAISDEDGLILVQAEAEAMSHIAQNVIALSIEKDSGFSGRDIKEELRQLKENGLHLKAVDSEKRLVVGGFRFSHHRSDSVIKDLKDKGFTVSTLPGRGASHTSLMEPIVEKIEEVLKHVSIKDADVEVIANSTGLPIKTKEEIREEILRQITRPILWTSVVKYLENRQIYRIFEVGAQRVVIDPMTNNKWKDVCIGACTLEGKDSKVLGLYLNREEDLLAA